MKKLTLVVLAASLISLTGCIAKMSGPGQVDVSKLSQTEEACYMFVMGFGPFGNAVLQKKPDTIQYRFDNFVVFQRQCAVGYGK
jgi:hypothetical protein